MGIARRVEVIKSVKELLEVVSGVPLLKSTAEGDEIEELTATDKLEDDVLDFLACSLLGVGLVSLTDFNHVYDVGVLDLG